MRIFRLETTASTNEDARGGRPGDVFVAEFQTAGRGRLDHAWVSSRGENLTFSAVLSDAGKDPSEIATLPLVVGLAIVRGVRMFLPRQSDICLKWPNDVLLQGRKLAGILCVRDGATVIAGIGLNVNQRAFPAEISSRATSLALHTDRKPDREAVLESVLASLNAYHARWAADGFAALVGEFAALDALKGRAVSVLQTDADAAPVTGICAGVNADGTLQVGNVRVCAGEAHVVA